MSIFNDFWKNKASGAKIGKGTKIWHDSQILSGAEIGDNCTIGHNCSIWPEAKLGNGVKIQCNTDVWNGVVLEDNVFISPSVVFTNDRNPRAKYPKDKEKRLGTLVEEGATIGANATIICAFPQRVLGKWCMIGAGAVVNNDIPNYAVVVGVPAKIIGWICECGESLEFEQDKAVCRLCSKKYIKVNNDVKLV